MTGRLRAEAIAVLIGYARMSKADGQQSLDLPTDALTGAGVDPGTI